MLDELKMILEVRPGDLVFIPSGVVRHRNARIMNPTEENRYSFVFYSAGNLFSWVANGFSTNDNAGVGPKQRESATPRRWQEGWALFPTLSEYNINRPP